MNRRRQIGFSLVEILVALAVGLFLTAGVLQIYFANSQTNRVAEATARIQENARFAMELLARDLRMAGYLSCATGALVPDNNLGDTSSFLYDFETALQGFEATSPSAWSPAVDASIVGALGGRDILTVRGMLRSEIDIVGSVDSDNCDTAALLVNEEDASKKSRLEQGDIAIAGDCGTAAIFQITSNPYDGSDPVAIAYGATGFSPGNADHKLGACYENDALGILSTRSYFVASNADGIPCLNYIDTSGANQDLVELVEGVADMQILYGLDIAGGDPASIDQYVPADLVTDWEKVASVRVSLLLQSMEDDLAADTRAHTVGGTVVNDRRLYRTFTTTLGVRNSLP